MMSATAPASSRSIATPAKRLGGFLLDVLYSWILSFVLALLIPSDPNGAGGYWITFLAYLAIGIYFWSKGTSPGKATLGMYVANKETGERVGFFAMLLRETIGKFLSGVILLVGYLWILFDADRQAWHDKFIGSIVVDARE